MFTNPLSFIKEHQTSVTASGVASSFPDRDDYVIFDGSDAYVSVNDASFLSTGSGSIAFWFLANSYSNNSYPMLFSARYVDHIELYEDVGNFHFRYGDGTTSNSTTISAPSLDIWHHMALIWNASSGTDIYLDGTDVGGHSGTWTNNPASGQFVIGGGDDINHSFSGVVSDFRVYDDILTADEVTYLHTEGDNGSDPTNDNLIAHYKFDEKSGNTVGDSAGSNNGVAINIAEPEFWDQYAVFGGVDEYVDLGTSSDFDVQEHSFTAWIYISDDTTENQIITRENVTTDGWEWGVVGNSLSYAYYDGATRGWYTGPTISNNAWHHVAGAWRPADSEVDFYLNGTLDSTVATTNGTITHDSGRIAKIGSRTLTSPYFGGKIYDVRLYNDALTSNEVSYIYTLGVSGSDPTTTDLIGRWKLTDGSGLTVSDEVGSNDGTAKNIVQPGFWNHPYVHFDGDNDYVELGSIATSNPISLGNESATIAFFIYRENGGDTYQRIIDRSSAGNGTNGFSVVHDPTYGAGFLVNGVSSYGQSRPTLDADSWQHFAVTLEHNGDGAYYVYGSQTHTITIDNIPDVVTNMRMGTWNHSTGREFDGRLSDVRVYNSGLSTNEILYLATGGGQGTDPTDSHLVAHWKYDERRGTTILDSAGTNSGLATNVDEATFWGPL